MRMSKGPPALLLLIVALQGCKITTPYRRVTSPASDSLYRDTTVTDTASTAALPCLQLFPDTILQSRIQEGIDNNLDLRIAVARMRQAEAGFRQSKAAFFPSLAANAGASLQKTGGSPSTQNYEAYLSSSWQVDLWGKLRSAKRAALAALLQSDAYKRNVQTQLVASIASDYYSLLALDQQLKVTLATVDNRKEDVETTKALKESDVLTGAAFMQSPANLNSPKQTLPNTPQTLRPPHN